MNKILTTFIFLFFSCVVYAQIGELDGENYTGTKAIWNAEKIIYRVEIKCGNPQTGKIQTVYKDIWFYNPNPAKNYENDYFLIWETTKNIILPFYQLYILDGGKWKLYSEIAQKL